jgi:hypothetical protein
MTRALNRIKEIDLDIEQRRIERQQREQALVDQARIQEERARIERQREQALVKQAQIELQRRNLAIQFAERRLGRSVTEKEYDYE